MQSKGRHGRDALRRSIACQAGWPSVSVQMVTYERPALLLEALQQVAAQDYPGSVEAVVVDDSAESLESKLKEARLEGLELPDINYVYLPDRVTIGAKRNLAARSTQADVLAIWDDDDLFTKDRLASQVRHLQGQEGGEVACSAIEVASIYSFPRSSLFTRPAPLPRLVFENTLCFTREWWEANSFGFGESWEVSGQGEGTLEPWWEDVQAISGDTLPFLYAQLKSSASGGTALLLDPHPPPDRAMHTLVLALGRGEFPENIMGKHTREMLDGSKKSLQAMLKDPMLFEPQNLDWISDFATFQQRYQHVRDEYLQGQR